MICSDTGTAARNGPIRLKNRPTVFMSKGRIWRASMRSSFGYTNGPAQAIPNVSSISSVCS